MTEVEKIKTVNDKLLSWLKDNCREFSWRENKSGYSVLVSEILLQQTTAERVEPIFNKLINVYSSFEELVAADIDSVLSIIESLGLHYRAKLLVDISKYICTNFEGKLPSEEKEIRSIEGVGQYILDSILCHVYSESKLPVDTNTYRVIGRLWGVEYPMKGVKAKRFVIDKAEKMAVATSSPQKLHYAVLDFAALQCKFYNPACESCPLNTICNFYNSS